MRISRRRFCQSALAISSASLFPDTVVFSQSATSSRTIPSEIRAVRLNRTDTSIEGAAVRELAESLDGQLLLSGDFGYDGARRIWNGMHERYPAIIVRARSTSDVVSAVNFARERELLLAVKGGGHSWPGRSVADGALMIDLSAINAVTVDPPTRRARIGGGALLYNLDFATVRHNLVTTAGIVSHTGVGGLTLGGGYGRLARKFGLTIDNLMSAELVTANGQVRMLSMLWPLAKARDVLHYYAENSPSFSDELFMAPGMTTARDGSAALTMDICFCGNPRDAERQLAPLRSVARPAIDGVVPAPYLKMQTRLDGTTRHGIRSYVKSGMVGEFTPALIDAMLESFEPGKGVTITSFATGGKIAQVAETATAWPHRNAHSLIGAVSFWPDESMDKARIDTTRAIWSGLEPHTGGYYANIQTDGAEVAGNYGPVYERLVSVKNAHDPMNLFRLNSNIRPTA
jgi:hypothetical protein